MFIPSGSVCGRLVWVWVDGSGCVCVDVSGSVDVGYGFTYLWHVNNVDEVWIGIVWRGWMKAVEVCVCACVLGAGKLYLFHMM